MASMNKVILVGHLGKDPELKYTPGGQPVATFSLATSERFNDKSGQKQERTEWHNIVVWGKQAELANTYLKKGRMVGIDGRITTRSWDDRDGVKKYKTEIVVNNLTFLGGAGGTGSGSSPSSNNIAETPSSNSYDTPDFQGSSSAMDDDLPF